MIGLSGTMVGMVAPGVEAVDVEAAGVEAPGVDAAGVDAPEFTPGVEPGVAGVTIKGATPGLSAPARGSTRGVDVTKRASLIR